MTKLERNAEQLAALGHAARLAIVREVVQHGGHGITTTDLQAKLGIAWTTLNHHIDRLVSADLLVTRREGKFALHVVNFPALRALTQFVWEDCCKRGKGASRGCC